MLEEYGDEIGLFGEMVDREKALEDSKKAGAFEIALSEKVSDIIGDQNLLESINKEIKQITDG